MSNLVLNKQEYKEILSTLNTTIGYIDKIASGFYGKEETALALLLGFRENKTLDQLAHIRYILQIAMEKQLSNEEYDEIIEQEEKVWKPPYNSSKEELLLMLEKQFYIIPNLLFFRKNIFGSFVQLHLEMMGLHNTTISWEVKKDAANKL